MTDEPGGHAAIARRQWDEHMSAWFERYAHAQWAAAEPYWGVWRIPPLDILERLSTPQGQSEDGC